MVNLEVPVRLWHLYILIPVRLRHLYILMLVLIFFYKNLQSFIVDVKFRIWNPIPKLSWFPLQFSLTFVLCHVDPMLPVTLDCPFLISPSVFSNLCPVSCGPNVTLEVNPGAHEGYTVSVSYTTPTVLLIGKASNSWIHRDKTFYGRHHELVDQYEISISHMAMNLFCRFM
jgi:hypothetical protein